MKKPHYFKRYVSGYALMMPALLLTLTISVYPIIYAIDWSFHETRYLNKVSFVGLLNYWQFFQKPANLQSIIVSLKYMFWSLTGSLVFGIGVASLLSKPLKFRGFFRTMIIMPWIISQTVNALLWKWMLSPDFGFINYLLTFLQLPKVDFFGNPHFALPTLAFANFWSSYPLVVVLTLAALQTIPEELVEAARIDGCSSSQVFFRIKMPLIQPTLLVIIIFLSLMYFNMVTLIYVATAGGPLTLTETVSVHLFKKAFEDWRIGYASAVGVSMFIANITFSLAYIRLLRREPYA
jgi:multiple sugar transport system permease protein